MEIKLEKGQRVNLVKTNGSKLTNFCVWCNWGNVTRPTFFGLSSKVVDVDLDLSCLMFDSNGQVSDYIYSPLYRFGDKNVGLPNGKLDSLDGALHHTGDELDGAREGEIITVDLMRVSPSISSIVFFLNIYSNEEFSGDFSEIPYASIRMYEGTPTTERERFASYDVATMNNCIGKRGLVMGKLYRNNGEWKFAAIGDAFEDKSIVRTITRVIKDYNR